MVVWFCGEYSNGGGCIKRFWLWQSLLNHVSVEFLVELACGTLPSCLVGWICDGALCLYCLMVLDVFVSGLVTLNLAMGSLWLSIRYFMLIYSIGATCSAAKEPWISWDIQLVYTYATSFLPFYASSCLAYRTSMSALVLACIVSWYWPVPEMKALFQIDNNEDSAPHRLFSCNYDKAIKACNILISIAGQLECLVGISIRVHPQWDVL